MRGGCFLFGFFLPCLQIYSARGGRGATISPKSSKTLAMATKLTGYELVRGTKAPATLSLGKIHANLVGFWRGAPKRIEL